MQGGIVIADDHPLILKGLQDFLIENGHDVVASATDGKSALKLILKHQPTLAILDIRMPRLDGLEVVKLLKEQGASVKVIMITFEKDSQLLTKAKAIGVDGYILKEFALTEIESCMSAIENGETYFSPSLNELVTDDIVDLSQLSPTEIKVLKHIAVNKTTKEIGEEMFISYRTVEKHRSNIIKKLNLEKHQNSLLIWAKDNQHHIL